MSEGEDRIQKMEGRRVRNREKNNNSKFMCLTEREKRRWRRKD
jgi:hypothetical protein